MGNHDYGLVIKRSDDFYIVDVDPGIYNSGYGVVSKAEDPYGKYDLADVKAWAAANPDKVLTEHPLEAEMQLRSQLAAEEAELEEINRQLFDEMVEVVFNAGVATMALDSEEGSDVSPVDALLAKRVTAMEAIADLKSQISALQAARSA